MSEVYVRNVGEFTHATAYQNIWAREVTVLGKRLGSLQEWELHQRNTHAAFVQFVQHTRLLGVVEADVLEPGERAKSRPNHRVGRRLDLLRRDEASAARPPALDAGLRWGLNDCLVHFHHPAGNAYSDGKM